MEPDCRFSQDVGPPGAPAGPGSQRAPRRPRAGPVLGPPAGGELGSDDHHGGVAAGLGPAETLNCGRDSEVTVT